MQNFNIEKELAEQTNKDWQFGALSKPGIVSIPEAERDIYLPIGETQFNGIADFTDCASRSPTNHLEALFTYHYLHNMKPENKAWMESNGYVTDNKVTFSDRFTAVLSGTTHQGNSLKAPIDSIYRNGLIPKKLLPKTDTMTWDEYYTPIPLNLIALGKEFLKRFTINYEQVFLQQFPTVLKDDMIGVAAYAWPTPVNGVYPRADLTPNHAFLLYKLPKYQAFDNYLDWNDSNTEQVLGDFTKNLAPDYAFFDYGYRVFVTSEQVPKTDEQMVIEAQVHSTLKKYGLLSFFQKFLSFFYAPRPEPLPPNPPITTTPKPDLIKQWAMAIQIHEGYYPDSRSYRNCNPANAKYIGQPDAMGQDKDGFAIFPSYGVGFEYLCRVLRNACEGKSKVYNPEMDLYDFFIVYAPREDNNQPIHYANTVANYMGVSPTAKIKTFVGG